MSLQLKQMPYLLKRGAKIEKKEIVTTEPPYYAVSMKSSIAGRMKRAPKSYIFLLSFLFVFEKTEGFFQINKFSCLAMIKKKILLICKQTEIIFGRKKT